MSKQFQENHRSTLVLSTATVPEISWSVSILARFMTKAGSSTRGTRKRKSFAIYKAEKASLSAGALAFVNSRICLATSMATPTPASLT